MTKGHWKRAPERAWTPEQVHQLEDLLGMGLSDAAIGRRLGRTAVAVNIVRKRRGIPCRRTAYNTCRRVADRLGMGCSKTVTKWIKRGWLQARAGQKVGPYHEWVIWEDALIAFLEDPRYWMAWDASKVTDSLLGPWVRELRTRESDLEGFVAPCNRPRAGQSHKRFTPAELADLARLRADGKTFQQIADRLERNIGSVTGAWYRHFADRAAAEAA